MLISLAANWQDKCSTLFFDVAYGIVYHVPVEGFRPKGNGSNKLLYLLRLQSRVEPERCVFRGQYDRSRSCTASMPLSASAVTIAKPFDVLSTVSGAKLASAPR